MDEQLRAWAARRRAAAGDPFELHPADRRLLQAEVARTFSLAGAPSAPNRARSWRLLSPRLAFVGAVATLLILAVIQLSPPPDRGAMDLAKIDAFAPTAPDSSGAQPTTPAPNLVPAPAPAGRAEKDEAIPIVATSAAVSPAEARTGELPVAPRSTPAPTVSRKLSYGVGAAPEPPPAPTSSRVEPERKGQPAAAAPQPAQPEEVPVVAESSSGTRPVSDAGPAAAPAPGGRAPSDRLVSLDKALEDRRDRGESLDRGSRLAEGQAVSAGAVLGLEPRPPGTLELPTFQADLSQARRYRANLNSPPMVVLQNFRLEQQGRQVQLVDADGSVYTGQLLGLPAAPGTAGAVAVSSLQSAGSSGPAALPFEVFGTNRTTRQSVRFQGTLSTSTPVRVQGQATVGRRTRLEVNAVKPE